MKGSLVVKSLLFILLLVGVPTLVALWNHGKPSPEVAPRPGEPRIRVREPGGRILEMGLEEYVKGVVFAEMPLGFDTQALAAQAVASRTYAYRRLLESPGAVISSNPAAHQGWKAWRLRLPIISGLLEKRLKEAMLLTRGVVVLHGGEPIDAVYHSTSGPETADSEEVWGDYVPYLRSVPCPYCSGSKRYAQTVSKSHAEIRKALGLAGDSKGRVAITIVSRTDSGRVREVSCNGRILTGVRLRNLLGLPSAAFTAESGEDGTVFHLKGYGHGVGMCQYGAQGMALQGKGYRDILGYYYTGVTFGKVGKVDNDGK